MTFLSGDILVKIKRKGVFFILSSPSGGGKTTLRDEILKRYPAIKYSVSYTTRKPRPGDVNGRDYHFVDKEEFKKLVKEDKFLEYAEVHSNSYGTGKEILKELDKGFDVLLDIDVQGGETIKKNFKDAVLLFILPPSWKILENRLRSRNTDAKDVIEKRLEGAKKEIERLFNYDYLLVNDTIDSMVTMFQDIYVSEKNKTLRLEVDWNDFYSY